MPELKPFEIQRFGGWVQKADPQEIGWGAAYALRNVDIGDGDVLATRAGTTRYNPTGLPTDITWIMSYWDDAQYLLVNNGTRLWDAQTNTLLTTSLSGGAITTNTQIGTSSASYVVFALDGGRMMKWEVGTGGIANLATNTRPLFVGRVPASNRLVIGNFASASYAPGGSGGSQSMVWFSESPNDGGSIETFPANNYIDLAPGDGEQIMGIETYKNFVLVFKQTKMFVMYGESIGPDGSTPEFNFREVSLGTRITRKYMTCSGQEGVYFMGSDGVYVTDGGAPVSVSAGAFDRDYWSENDVDVSQVAYLNGRLYVGLDSNGPSNDTDDAGSGLFVYDVDGGYWLRWAGLPFDVTTADRTCLTPANDSMYMMVYDALGANHISYFDPDVATDAVGATTQAITAYYYTGYQQASPAGSEGVMREVLLDGTGTVTCNLNVDGTDQTSASVTPTAATIGRYRKAARGRMFQLKLSSTSGAWSLSRVVGNVQPGRNVGAA